MGLYSELFTLVISLVNRSVRTHATPAQTFYLVHIHLSETGTALTHIHISKTGTALTHIHIPKTGTAH